MTTPAQKVGIVLGKSYKVTATDAQHYSGGVYELVHDDGSDLPYFRLVSGFDGPQDKEACIWVDGTAGTVLTEVKDYETDDVSYNIDVSSTGTIVKTSRKLSLDQIKAIMEIIGG